MAQCGICEEKEGVREAGVYMDGEKKAVPVCAGCVYEAMRRNFYGIASVRGFSFAGSWWQAKACSACRVFLPRPLRCTALCGLRCCLPRALRCGAPRRKRALCGLGVEACHGPGCDGGCPARRLCGTVLQCKGADAA